ncbi:hypothetical protein ACFL59_16165, partial [Planctomycetota bacterium]
MAGTADSTQKKARAGRPRSGRLSKKELEKRTTSLEVTLQQLQQRLAVLEADKVELERELARLEGRDRLSERLQSDLASRTERFELLARIAKDLNSLNDERIFDICITKIPYLLNAHYA